MAGYLIYLWNTVSIFTPVYMYVPDEDTSCIETLRTHAKIKLIYQIMSDDYFNFLTDFFELAEILVIVAEHLW